MLLAKEQTSANLSALRAEIHTWSHCGAIATAKSRPIPVLAPMIQTLFHRVFFVVSIS
jgi:hypothetical protein